MMGWRQSQPARLSPPSGLPLFFRLYHHQRHISCASLYSLISICPRSSSSLSPPPSTTSPLLLSLAFLSASAAKLRSRATALTSGENPARHSPLLFLSFHHSFLFLYS
ncbi:hypothetical protein L1887_38750 [Cichorium endivia]|nr:hypothetical protein L1887_38750 [Cichorium endivia]